MTFHCRYCAKEIFTQGASYYNNATLKAYWYDEATFFFCLDSGGDYILPHAPLLAEIAASTDAIMNNAEMAEVSWRDELDPSERAMFMLLRKGDKHAAIA